MDEIDNIADARSPSTPHCGAIEGKVLRGSDGRDYVLEVMRLTPRDANYVLGEKGTGKVALAEKADKDLAVTYLLRRELVELFIQNKLATQRQAVMVEAQAKQKELLAAVTPAPVAEGETPKVEMLLTVPPICLQSLTYISLVGTLYYATRSPPWTRRRCASWPRSSPAG